MPGAGGIAADRIVLSLDFKDGRFLGPDVCGSNRRSGRSALIAMTLSRVGADTGPDFELLDQLRTKAPGKKLFAAGGVRGGEDLSNSIVEASAAFSWPAPSMRGGLAEREIAAVCA